jgi:hypothetical protein
MDKPFVRGLIERIGRAEDELLSERNALKHVAEACTGLLKRAENAEDRIAELELAIGDFLAHLNLKIGCCTVTELRQDKLRAALAAPSGVNTVRQEEKE